MVEAASDAAFDDLLEVVSALSRLGDLDLRGGASLRRGSTFVTTPRPAEGVPPPRSLARADLVTVDPDGERTGGRWDPPLDVALDLALYRRRPDVQAIVRGQPEVALAFAAAGRALAPLTHTEAALVLPSMPVLGDGALVGNPEAALAAAEAMGDRPVTILRGQGSVAVGGSPAEAGMLTHQVGILGRVNALVATLPRPAPMLVATADSARITDQKAPPGDFQDFFAELARSRPPAPEMPDAADGSEGGLRARIAAACRLLFAHGLVEHLEHVSVLLPGGDRFLMTPRKHLGRLRAGDIAVVGMDGAWREGPLPPPPFLWLHRDLFEARPDVRAIVHTHQPVGRALVMAGTEVRPIVRAGAGWVAARRATYPVPDLMFDPIHRAGALAVLGGARILHEASHGTEYLAATVEEATVGAILYERQARMWHLASQLGRPAGLPPGVLSAAGAEEPSDLDWWRFLWSELSASR